MVGDTGCRVAIGATSHKVHYYCLGRAIIQPEPRHALSPHCCTKEHQSEVPVHKTALTLFAAAALGFGLFASTGGSAASIVVTAHPG